jgi:hypothetical protein
MPDRILGAVHRLAILIQVQSRLDRVEVVRGRMGATISLPAVGTAVAILLVLVVMLWFTWGTQRNISRGNALLRWLQPDLPLLGRRATVKWLGSSAVEVGIVEPASPFAEASLVVVLEPRDVPWFWAWSRRRGRRDFLILRARLDRPPGLELEAVDESGWTGTRGTAALDEDALVPADWDRSGLRVIHTPGSDPALLRPLFDRIAEASGGVWRLSVRREPPHLEVHVRPPETAADPPGAEELIRAFADLAQTVLRV